MPSIGRLLVAALLLTSVGAFAQDHQLAPSAPSNMLLTQAPDFRTTPPSSEPWKIFPNAPIDKAMTLAPTSDENGMVVPGVSPTDRYCLAINSYVVARDRKDSDAVHLVSHTTCVPAQRFGLKKTLIQQDSAPVAPE